MCVSCVWFVCVCELCVCFVVCLWCVLALAELPKVYRACLYYGEQNFMPTKFSAAKQDCGPKFRLIRYIHQHMSTSVLGKVFEWNKMASLTNLLKMFEEF